MANKKLVFVLLLISVIFIAGCTSTQDRTIQKYRIGDIASNGALSVIINSVNISYTLFKESVEPNSTYNANPGYKFIIVGATVKNVGNSQYLFNPLYFVLHDQNNQKYFEQVNLHLYLDSFLDVSMLAPGESETGFMIFNIPNNSTENEISYAISNIIKSDTTKPIIIELT